jgi:uncharacterized protein
MKLKNLMLAGVLSLFIFGCAPAQEIQIIEAEERSISVTGLGEVKVAPDMAEVVLGIYTLNRDINVAMEENDENTQNVLEALKKHNIDEKDIQIDYLNINSKTSDNSQNVYQYEIKNNIKVTVHELRELESIITDALNAGANRMSGVYFRVIELELRQDEARKLAMEAAKEKAATLAGQLGQEVGEPISIYESQDVYAPTLYTAAYNEYNYNYNLNQVNTMVFRQIAIRVSITVRFGLK